MPVDIVQVGEPLGVLQGPDDVCLGESAPPETGLLDLVEGRDVGEVRLAEHGAAIRAGYFSVSRFSHNV
jgi:hypothetical protein